jgi:hypothetical protein
LIEIQNLFKNDKKTFDANWQKLAKEQPKGFGNAQHKYIHDTHFKPLSTALKTQRVLDVSNKSAALKDTVWSVAVQHGSGSKIIQNALKGKNVSKLSDANVISSIYKERSKIGPNGNLKYFSGSPKLKNGLLNRFKDEEKRALQMLNPARKPMRPLFPPLPKPKGTNAQPQTIYRKLPNKPVPNRVPVQSIRKPVNTLPVRKPVNMPPNVSRIKTMPVNKPMKRQLILKR